MRSTILLSTLLASTSLVLAQATNSTNNGTTITCGETCHTIIDKGCAKDDLACQCKSDYEVQIPFWKCLYDGCPMEAASLAIGVYGLACSEAIANATTASKTSTSAAAIPTSAPASSFRLPTCAEKCVTKSTVPTCEKGDPACVCGTTSTTSNDDNMDLVNKCVVDTCSSVDAAIALTRITEDCGFVPASMPADQRPFPYNGFAQMTASGHGNSTNTTSGNSTAGNSTTGGNSTGGQPNKLEGAAMVNGMSLLATCAAAFMGVALF